MEMSLFIKKSDDQTEWIQPPVDGASHLCDKKICLPNVIELPTQHKKPIIQMYQKESSTKNIWFGNIILLAEKKSTGYKTYHDYPEMTKEILQLSYNTDNLTKGMKCLFNTKWFIRASTPEWVTINVLNTTNSIESKFPFIMLYTQNETPNLPIAQLSCHFGKFTATNPATFVPGLPCQRSGGHFQVLKFKNCGTNIITPDGTVRALFKQGRQYYVKQKINGEMAYVHVHKIK